MLFEHQYSRIDFNFSHCTRIFGPKKLPEMGRQLVKR
ncbi:twin-arginine translocase TatA/TatE family subunit [Anaerobacillus sp. HL2]|nr:twin-arginine translocase TatA/TatE family subunit [Anaerobacillus sp. HL2]